ncbi:MAG: hypothetical protein A2563_02575 [Candidatus Magasanikbacteria bacterium RIFOXYD1_FULL_40_23]|uniref:Uncharacterized protein n=1 Tax=Candidatus Magasanikbacteria bacterium RIFOXYD1_FULL_40_23 TaxID=1798705 RepID=A0A1F6P8P9_9BACT|nr:MAG: hypothetical protein A2563_02575 [Candidatus Magasanikbacteria bacterium RIFOXYD1_FULL_40_23]
MQPRRIPDSVSIRRPLPIKQPVRRYFFITKNLKTAFVKAALYEPRIILSVQHASWWYTLNAGQSLAIFSVLITIFVGA